MAASSTRNDLVKNYRVHPTYWLISTQEPTCSSDIDSQMMRLMKSRRQTEQAALVLIFSFPFPYVGRL